MRTLGRTSRTSCASRGEAEVGGIPPDSSPGEHQEMGQKPRIKRVLTGSYWWGMAEKL